jgi:microcompartment protein CcmL/EutN
MNHYIIPRTNQHVEKIFDQQNTSENNDNISQDWQIKRPLRMKKKD